MVTLALDPGTTRSALVLLEDGIPRGMWLEDNADILRRLRIDGARGDAHPPTLVVEQVQGYGMAVGAEVFETCVWTGRFLEAWGQYGCDWRRLPRRAVKLHLCGQARAKDVNIRQALIDRYGGKDAAIGKKATPGPLYGIKADLWAALALGICWQDGVRA